MGREVGNQFNLQSFIYSGTKYMFLANFFFSQINAINRENKINSRIFKVWFTFPSSLETVNNGNKGVSQYQEGKIGVVTQMGTT